jgi:hypothetical protein
MTVSWKLVYILSYIPFHLHLYTKYLSFLFLKLFDRAHRAWKWNVRDRQTSSTSETYKKKSQKIDKEMKKQKIRCEKSLCIQWNGMKIDYSLSMFYLFRYVTAWYNNQSQIKKMIWCDNSFHTPHHITSHHITPHHTLHYTTPHHTTPHHTTPHHIHLSHCVCAPDWKQQQKICSPSS